MAIGLVHRCNPRGLDDHDRRQRDRRRNRLSPKALVGRRVAATQPGSPAAPGEAKWYRASRCKERSMKETGSQAGTPGRLGCLRPPSPESRLPRMRSRFVWRARGNHDHEWVCGGDFFVPSLVVKGSCRTRRQQASIFCISLLPAPVPRSVPGGRSGPPKNAQPHLEVSHLLAGAVFHKKVSVRASK